MSHTPRRRVFTLASGRSVVADESGDPGGQPVVLLHGGGQTRHAWAGAARSLAAAGYRPIAMDHRGHGESDWHPSGDYSVDGFAGDLAEVIAQLEAPPVLVGASLGGICAILVEGAAPSPVARAIVLVDVTPRLEIPGVQRIIQFMAARPDGFADLDEVAEFVASYMPHRARPADARGLEKNLRVGADGRYRWHWDPRLLETWNPARFDPVVAQRIVRERLALSRNIRVPLLLVRGRMSDVVSEEGAREFLAAVPHAEYVDLAAAGHMVAGDKNDAFSGAVVGFIDRVVGPGADAVRR
jgi:pimeloyl-ACP methyl ester carboxylesterase